MKQKVPIKQCKGVSFTPRMEIATFCDGYYRQTANGERLSTANGKRQTANGFATVNPLPLTVNLSPLTINPLPLTVNPLTVNPSPLTVNRLPHSTNSREYPNFVNNKLIINIL